MRQNNHGALHDDVKIGCAVSRLPASISIESLNMQHLQLCKPSQKTVKAAVIIKLVPAYLARYPNYLRQFIVITLDA